jgi:hypothetical protein
MLAYRKLACRRGLAVSLALSALLLAGPAASTPSPFDTVKGSWGGGGNLTLEGGKHEKLDCTAYYTSSGGGRNLGVALRCAGETRKFELRSHLDYDAGKISGSWEERVFNASGDASGNVKPGSIQLHFSGGVSGDMTVAFTASSQSISISVDAGGAVSGVHLQMSRR